MNLTLFGIDKQYDAIVEALAGREQEWFFYKLDLDNFTFIAGKVEEGEYKDHLLKRIEETKLHMGRVEQVYHALLNFATNQGELDAAIARRRLKEAR